MEKFGFIDLDHFRNNVPVVIDIDSPYLDRVVHQIILANVTAEVVPIHCGVIGTNLEFLTDNIK